jgi:hypothetical protein
MDMRKIATLACLAGASFLSSTVLADTVTYSTQGGFGTPSIPFPVGSPSITSGDSVVTFMGAGGSVSLAEGDFTNVTFGTFTVASTDGIADTFNSQFNLLISQTSPTTGDQPVTDTLTGKVSSSSSTVSITFDSGDVVTIGGVEYTPLNVFLSPPSTGGTTTFSGLITLVQSNSSSTPLPLAAVGGMGLMGMVASKRRRMGAFA